MRSNILDSAKGFGIVCVVIGHEIVKVQPSSFQDNLLYNVIYTFHMPLFFIISGYLMYQSLKGDRVQWIKKKACQLLIPHFVFNIALYFLSQLNITEFPNFAKTYSFGQYIMYSTFADVGEWFLWTLFMVCCLVLIVDWLQKYNMKKFIILSILLTIIIVCLPINSDSLRMARIQYYFPIFLSGYLIAKYKLQIKLKYILWSLHLSLGLFVLVMIVSKWNGGWGSIPSVDMLASPIDSLLRYAQVITVAPLVYLIVWSLSENITVLWLGKMTLGIYLFNLLFAGLYIRIGNLAILSGTLISLAIGVTLTLIISRNNYLGVIIGNPFKRITA
jgi:fucose 4-O-acetylase-like acetyltransferase